MLEFQIPPTQDWLVFVGFLFSLFLLLGITDWLRRAHAIDAEISRKTVHFLTGLLVLTTPFIFETQLPLVILAVLFVIINTFALKFDFFEGIHSAERKSYGTVFYPLSFLILVLLFWKPNLAALLIGMGLMAIADVVAAIVGENSKSPIALPLSGDRKTWQGSAAMFLTSTILIFFGLILFAAQTEPLHLLFAVIGIALLATAAEMISWRGSDNLTVPIFGSFATYFFLHAQPANVQQFFIGEMLALMVAVISYRARFLDASGAIAAFMLGSIVFGLGGWTFTLPMLAFFILSSLLSRLSPIRKKQAAQNFQKGSRRDLGQVLANGGVPGLIVIFWYLAPRPLWYFLYLGSIAAVTADTWATEIGLLSKKRPRLITSWRSVASGTSGAITNLGLAGAILGAVMISVIGWSLLSDQLNNQIGLLGIAVITISGVLAHLLDSLLGATIQAQQACSVCHSISEKKGRCCGIERQLHSGWRWVDNDVVNGMCALGGVLVVLLGINVLV